MVKENIGREIADRYELVEEIGRGGLGAVYRANDTVLGRSVAVKLLRRGDLGSKGAANLLAEARSAAGLNHRNIVQIHDAGSTAEPDGEPGTFIVMELVDGSTFDDRPKNDFGELVGLLVQICEALKHAHESGIIHRDIKPENVMVTVDGVVKLTDFGLARSIASRATTDGSISGTFSYLAPEIALGSRADERSDLYSLGVMLYEALTGELPFSEKDPLAVMAQHIHAPIVPPLAKADGVPVGLSRLTEKLMAKEPNERPQNAEAVLEILNLGLEEPDGESQEVELFQRLVRSGLVGREEDLAEAKKFWLRAEQGDGHVLTISGEPGVGKTRLLESLLTMVRVRGGRVLEGASFEELPIPFGSFIEALRALRGGEVLGSLSPRSGEVLSRLVPGLVRGSEDVTLEASGDVGFERDRLLIAIAELFELVSKERPTLLVLEDLHWSDQGSLDLFAYLARRAKSLPLLIVGTYREIELDSSHSLDRTLASLNRERLASRIKLKRLNRGGVKRMLDQMFAEDVSIEFAERMYGETDGNPFFVEEVCRSLIEQGTIYYEDGEWQRTELSEFEIPQSVRTAVQERFLRLEGAHRTVIELGAVIGREFDYELLEAIHEERDVDLVGALEAGERARLFGETSSRNGGTFTFVHALTPVSIRDSLSGLKRRRTHLVVAKAIEATRPDQFGVIGSHYDLAGSRAAAVRNYVKASEAASQKNAPGDAGAFLSRAVENWDDDGDRRELARLLTRLAEIQNLLKQFEEAATNVTMAIEIAEQIGDHALAAEAELVAGWSSWIMGDSTAGLKHVLSAHARHAGGGASRVLAAAKAEVARFYMLVPDDKKAIEFGEAALKMAESLGATDVVANTLTTLAIVFDRRKETDAQAQEMFTKAERLATADGDALQILRAVYNRAEGFQQAGEIDAALETCGRATELATKFGSLTFIDTVNVTRNLARLEGGRWSELFEEWPPELRETQAVWFIWHESLLAKVEAICGRTTESLRLLAKHKKSIERAVELQTVGAYFRALAASYLESGDIEAGLLVVEAALAKFESAESGVGMRTESLYLFARTLAEASGSGLEVQPTVARTRRLLLIGQESANRARPAAYWFAAQGILARLEGDVDSSLEHLRKSARIARDQGMKYPELQFLGDLVETQGAAVNDDSATSVRERGLEIARDLAQQIPIEKYRAGFLGSRLVAALRAGSAAS